MRIDSSGVKKQLVAIDRALELDAFFGDLAQLAKAEYLKATAIGQDGFVPAHKGMQAAVLADDVDARAQPQVEGVSEDDLGFDLVQIARRHRLDRAIGAHRHEYRRLHHAVVKRDLAAPRAATGGLQLKIEAVKGCCHCCIAPCYRKTVRCMWVKMRRMVPDYLPLACSVALLFQQHRIAITKEAIFRRHCVRIGRAHGVEAGKGRHQHQQGGFGQMEIGHQAVDHFELVAGGNENIGIALRLA